MHQPPDRNPSVAVRPDMSSVQARTPVVLSAIAVPVPRFVSPAGAMDPGIRRVAYTDLREDGGSRVGMGARHESGAWATFFFFAPCIRAYIVR
jgi:hypothetical protein